jgi:hypothetical protein
MEDSTKIQVSAKTYWGFNIEIPNNKLYLMSNIEIVEEIKKKMITFFKNHNLEELKEGVNNLNLHIHEPISLGQTIYVCDHGED